MKTEERFATVRERLVGLGYKQPFKIDSLLLVEKLLADLGETTHNLSKYIKIAKSAVEERDNLELSAIPLKQDNAKLVKECNELHLAFLQLKEQNDAKFKDLRRQIDGLETERSNLLSKQGDLFKRIHELEVDAHRKLFTAGKAQPRSSGTSSTMVLSNQKISNLIHDNGKLKSQLLNVTELNSELKSKICELEKLVAVMENNQYCGEKHQHMYHDVKAKLARNEDEIAYLTKAKSDLDLQLKEARCKQHEAMKNALQLAERNEILERELRDIDQMALAVEQECNASVKHSSQKYKKLQERLQDALSEVQKMDKDLHDLKINKDTILGDLEAERIEKKHLQAVLETALDDKKMLTDRINKFVIIERDLNSEIDRLVQQSAEQKRTIADLKGRIAVETYGAKFIDQPEKDVSRKPSPSSKRPTLSKRTRSPQKPRRKSTAPPSQPISHIMHPLPSPCLNEMDCMDLCTNPCNTLDSLQRMRCNFDEGLMKCCPTQCSNPCDREYYCNMYQNLMEGVRCTFTSCKDECNDVKLLQEKDELIRILKQDKEQLAKEKHNLMSRLETVRDYTDGGDYCAIKASLRRVERERDLLKNDVERLEEERDAIKNRLKIVGEMHAAEVERYQKLLCHNEEDVRKLERERHDLMHRQDTKSSALSNLEDECGALKKQLSQTKEELIQFKTLYAQIKVLHEQSDRALSDSQAHIKQLEKEVDDHRSKHSTLDGSRTAMSKELNTLKDDISVLKRSLTEMEVEKDNMLLQLDEKTERVANLESELKISKQYANDLEQQLLDAKGKMSVAMDEGSLKEMKLKTTTNEIQTMRKDFEATSKMKEAALLENRRLQEELAASCLDVRKSQAELENARRQIDDLKRQLQQYVAEVKRIEDLMAHKEIERSEMLDQFKTLSHEATVLENNNFSLENEATQSKVQLSVALDHATELEQRLDKQCATMAHYERQISELSAQIANMKAESKGSNSQQDRLRAENLSMQELCMKLDRQKEQLIAQMHEDDAIRKQMEHELNILKSNYDTANKKHDQERNNVQSLEMLLSENRQQLVEQRILNEEMQAEIAKLKRQINEMERNLQSTTERLDMYQEKTLQFSKENKHLRREITNEGYHHDRKYPSL